MKIFISLFFLILIPSIEAITLKEAISSDIRSEQNVSRDFYRNPYETLNFFGIKANMKVLELSPVGGWYTEILSQYLLDQGELLAAHFNPENGVYQTRSRRAFDKKINSNEAFSKVKTINIDSVFSDQGGIDAILTFRNLHNWVGPTMDSIFKNSFDALNPDGIFGIVEHRGKKGLSISEMKKSGYVSEAYAIKEAKKHGFVFVAKSEINANPKDLKKYPKGVWTLPPSMRMKEVNAETYLAIGESDRFTLLFKKP
jgi:predicted methyltransferase